MDTYSWVQVISTSHARQFPDKEHPTSVNFHVITMVLKPKASVYINSMFCTAFLLYLSTHPRRCIVHQDENMTCPKKISNYSFEILPSDPYNDTNLTLCCDIRTWQLCNTHNGFNENIWHCIKNLSSFQLQSWVVETIVIGFVYEMRHIRAPW